MRNTMKRIWAMALVVMMVFSMAPGALAASEYYSGSLTVGGRVKATAAPTAAPTPAPEAQEPAADVEPAESVEPAADPVESAQPDETPVETPAASTEPEETPDASTEPEETPDASTEPEETPDASTEPEEIPDASTEPEETPAASTEPEETPAASTEPEETPVASTEPEETPEQSEWPRAAVVNKTGTEKVVNIRMEPNAEATRVGRATDGDPLTVYGERKGWMDVETADGVRGWMSAKFVSFDLPETEPDGPVDEPTAEPTAEPVEDPVEEPTAEPTVEPVEEPTVEPVEEPTAEPTVEPTAEPEVEEEPTDGLEGEEPAFEPIEGLVVNNDADVRLEADGLSEILVTIDAETPVTVIGIEGDWVKIIVDGVVGYVFIDDIESIRDVEGVLPEPTPAPSTAPEETPAPNFKVTIFSSRRSVMMPGETVTLTSKLEGFEGYETLLQWECDKGNGYENVEGANGDSYSFEASVETLSYGWRLTVYYRPAVTE